jgi:hypothetical protein
MANCEVDFLALHGPINEMKSLALHEEESKSKVSSSKQKSGSLVYLLNPLQN